VFASNPVPFVNGSLWTLPVEALFYLLLPFLLLLATQRRWIVLVPLHSGFDRLRPSEP